MVFLIMLTAVLLAALTCTLIVGTPSLFAQLKLRPEWVFIVQLVGVTGWQLIRIRAEEYNVDESTWIANALAVGHDADFFSALLTHTTARPITVLPLLVLDKLGLPIDFYFVKVVGVGCILVTLLLTFLALRNLTSARFATFAMLPLTIFYVAVQFDDFVAYNSELVCNILVVAGVWLYSLVVERRERVWQLCLAGLLLGLIPFAKFQAIPGALVVVGFCLNAWVQQRRLASALLFMVAGLVPVIVAVVYCWLTGQINVLLRNYFLYYVHYSYQYSPRPFSERFSPWSVLYYYRKQYTFAAYWIGLLLLMGIRLWQSSWSSFRWSSTRLMVLLLWLISIYETIQAGTNYEHYLNLVLVPNTLLVALLIYPVDPVFSDQQRLPIPILVGFGYIVVALVIPFFSHTKPFERGYAPPLRYDLRVVALIRKECTPNDQIAVWGWADRYYALSGIAPASRYANTVFQMKSNAQQGYYLDQYALDLKQRKPLLFIDAVAADQFTYDNQRRYGHEHFPAINQIIRKDYTLIYERDGLRMYKLKNTASPVMLLRPPGDFGPLHWLWYSKQNNCLAR